MPLHLLDGRLHFDDAARGVPAAAYVGRHVREQKILVDRVPDRPLGEGEPGADLTDRRIGVDQILEFRPQRRMRHRFVLPSVVAQAGNQLRFGSVWSDRAGNGILHPRHDDPAFDPGRTIVHRQNEAGVGEHFLDRALLGALGHAVVAGRLRLAVVVLPEGLHDLVVDVVDDVAANRRDAFGGVNVHVHRSFGMCVRGLAEDAGHEFNRAADFEVEEAQRILGVQAVDEVLDVGRRILRMHGGRRRNIRAPGD